MFLSAHAWVWAMSLLAGLSLQAWAACAPGKYALLRLLTGGGAVSAAALYDRDLTLLLAQWLVLPLLWLCTRRGS